MRTKWDGHACFGLEDGETSVVTDPYGPGVSGLDPVAEPADLVVVSSATDAYHSNASMVPGNPLYLDASAVSGEDVVEVGGVRFETFPWRAWSTRRTRTRTPCTASSWEG